MAYKFNDTLTPMINQFMGYMFKELERQKEEERYKLGTQEASKLISKFNKEYKSADELTSDYINVLSEAGKTGNHYTMQTIEATLPSIFVKKAGVLEEQEKDKISKYVLENTIQGKEVGVYDKNGQSTTMMAKDYLNQLTGNSELMKSRTPWTTMLTIVNNAILTEEEGTVMDSKNNIMVSKNIVDKTGKIWKSTSGKYGVSEGVPYIDINKNQQLDEGEKGLHAKTMTEISGLIHNAESLKLQKIQLDETRRSRRLAEEQGKAWRAPTYMVDKSDDANPMTLVLRDNSGMQRFYKRKDITKGFTDPSNLMEIPPTDTMIPQTSNYTTEEKATEKQRKADQFSYEELTGIKDVPTLNALAMDQLKGWLALGEGDKIFPFPNNDLYNKIQDRINIIEGNAQQGNPKLIPPLTIGEISDTLAEVEKISSNDRDSAQKSFYETFKNKSNPLWSYIEQYRKFQSGNKLKAMSSQSKSE